MIGIPGPIRAVIPSQDDDLHFDSVPDAVAACRRHFMAGHRESCHVFQDHLIYRIDASTEWSGNGLP